MTKTTEFTYLGILTHVMASYLNTRCATESNLLLFRTAPCFPGPDEKGAPANAHWSMRFTVARSLAQALPKGRKAHNSRPENPILRNLL